MNGDTPSLVNDTKGSISLVGGSGAFASMLPTQKIVFVEPGGDLTGRLVLHVLRRSSQTSGTGDPLIATPSWGDSATSWFVVARSVSAGYSEIDADVRLVAPRDPGVYSIVFSFLRGRDAVAVASGSDSQPGSAQVWDQLDALANFNSSQVADAQAYGCAIARRAQVGGYSWELAPADAVNVIVRS